VVAAYLRSYPPIPGLDREDLIQEGHLAWLEARDTYRPDRGASRATYLGHVVTNHLRSVVRAERAKKRGAGTRALSLDVPVTEDGSTLAELLADDAPTPHRRVESDELTLRLLSLRQRLTARQRDVLDALADERPLRGIARDLGIHHSTVYQDIARIQKVARDEGLEEFLR